MKKRSKSDAIKILMSMEINGILNSSTVSKMLKELEKKN